MDLTDTVDSTHDQLVKVSSKQEVGFESKCHEEYIPDQLSALIIDVQKGTHLLYSLCCDTLDSCKQSLHWLERLFTHCLSRLGLSHSHWLLMLGWITALTSCILLIIQRNDML